MDFKAKLKEFLTKLQNLPEQNKKIILWSVVVILAIIMGIFWIKGAINNLSKIGESVNQIQFPQIETPDIPSMTIPATETQTVK
jgi:hypothetical protein